MKFTRLLCLSILTIIFATHLATDSATAQLIVNEANAVSVNNFLDVDTDKPYEGFDFGAIAYSGLANPVDDPIPGNPFPADVDAGPETVTMLNNGWDLSQPTGWARIEGNGGDWIELVITEDHTDLRGFTIYWENDEDGDFFTGEGADERGFINFRNHQDFADLRAGTIVTLSEQAFADEIRDQYPVDPTPEPFPGEERVTHDTGHDYSLLTDTSFDPFSANDWHQHFHVDETLTDLGQPTEYFAGDSDVKVDGDEWTVWIFDKTNTAVLAESEDDGVLSVSDTTTGLVHGPIGEAVPNWGVNTGASGVGGDESLALTGDPVTGAVPDDYEDLDFSTFGMPNLSNLMGNEGAVEAVQDFSTLRNAVLANTHDWVATGTADVSAAANWINTSSGATPANGPQAAWTMRLNNSAGGASVAQVSSNTTIAFAAVIASAGTMKLEVQSGATLDVTGAAHPGRVLVMDGGIAEVNGTVNAAAVETFSGGVVSGNGFVSGGLANSGGTVVPGSSAGNILSVGGDYVQTDDATLSIVISGPTLGDLTFLDVAGSAALDGFLDVTLDGFTPTSGASFVVLEAASIDELGLALGNANGFSLSVTATQVLVTFEGVTSNPDFNNDGELDCTDIDALVVEIAGSTNAAAFDLTGDGLVNLADRDEWLALAGAENLDSGNSYLLGDATLDGNVDGADFLVWNGNKFTPTAAWCAGDFDASGSVDGRDFLVWNNNKFTSADLSAVPEPTLGLLVLLGLALLVRARPAPAAC